jgi:hypothetical protein
MAGICVIQRESDMKNALILFLVLSLVGSVGTVSMAAESPPSGAERGSIRGTVLEAIDVAGYTYMRLKTGNGEVWAAVQKVAVKRGSDVTIMNVMPMNNFESKTLKRKFDIIFFGNIGPATAAAAESPQFASGHGGSVDRRAQEGVAAPHASLGNAPVGTGEIKVKKAEGPGGKTVSEICVAKASLKEVSVAVRGKVVKYNPGIMGKNWIHLRDGSGSNEKKDNDITVTTSDSAAVGDVILVKGRVRLDRDFGSGYVYPVIIEDAKVSK